MGTAHVSEVVLKVGWVLQDSVMDPLDDSRVGRPCCRGHRGEVETRKWRGLAFITSGLGEGVCGELGWVEG